MVMKASRADEAWIAANAHKWKPVAQITREGQPCRHCNTPVRRHTHGRPLKPKPGGYYYEWWFKCPRCSAVYLVDDAKRFFEEPTSKAVLDIFEDEPEPVAAREEVAFVDDGLPPWD